MLKCPRCSDVTDVIDSRDSGERIRRRHKCRACSSRFTTYEVIEDREVERQKNVIKVKTYRKKFVEDKRSDQEILNSLDEASRKSHEELIQYFANIIGIFK